MTLRLVLFDFAAALPGVSYDFLHRMLHLLVPPIKARNLIRALYHSNKAKAKLKGCAFPWLTLTAWSAGVVRSPH